mmetsp:Transcript_7672/g.11894  ORF Transcript_7672/g.11894 Transcript_7672/m.11894 type:complete len:110 (-) Transcript_7672:284-613(-)
MHRKRKHIKRLPLVKDNSINMLHRHKAPRRHNHNHNKDIRYPHSQSHRMQHLSIMHSHEMPAYNAENSILCPMAPVHGAVENVANSMIYNQAVVSYCNRSTSIFFIQHS